MAGLSISKSWDETKRILGRDGKLIVSVALALIVLPSAIGTMAAPPPNLSGQDPPSWAPLLGLLIALIGVAGQIALIRLALAPAVVGEAIGHGFKRLLPGFLALLLFGIGLMIVLTPILMALVGGEGVESLASGRPGPEVVRAMLLVGLVAVAVAARFQLILPVAAAESGGPIRIIRQAWRHGTGNYWRLLAFVLLSLLLAVMIVLVIGQLMGGLLAKAVFGIVEPFSIGALIAGLIGGAAQAAFAVIVSVMLARIYLQAAGDGAAEASVPSSAG